MKPKTILTTIMCVVALSAITASSAAAALPEFQSSTGYPYKFSGIAGKVNGEFEGGLTLTCEKASLSGEFTNQKELAKVVETFTHCESIFIGDCPTVTTKSLKGHIAYINKTEHRVGLELEGEGGGAEPTWAEFPGGSDCNTSVIKGHLIGELNAPINKEGEKEFNLRYIANKGIQAINGFEGGPTGQQLRLVFEPENPRLGLNSEIYNKVAVGYFELKA